MYDIQQRKQRHDNAWEHGFSLMVKIGHNMQILWPCDWDWWGDTALVPPQRFRTLDPRQYAAKHFPISEGILIEE